MAKGPGHEHWRATDKELAAWSTEAAELLGKIPARAVESVINASAAATVVVGLGGMVMSRVAIDTMIAQAVEADRRAREAAMNQAAPVETVDAEPPVRVENGTVQSASIRHLFSDELISATGGI